MNNKVLIISTAFMGSAEALKKELERRGYTCTLLHHDRPPVGIVQKITNTVLKRNANNKKQSEDIDRFSETAMKAFEELAPFAVIDTLGSNLNAKTVDSMREKAVVVKMLGDSVKTYPYLEGTLSHYDVVSTYEKHDIPNIKACGVSDPVFEYATYKACNFYPTENAEKKYDVCFVGKMFTNTHKKRRIYMEKLVKANPDLKFAIYGVYAKKHYPLRYLKWKFKDGGKYFKNRNIKPQDVNRLYAESKICVSVNSFQTYDCWSARFVEILGAGGFLLSEYTPDSEKCFEGGFVSYKNFDELNAAVRKYVNDDAAREQIARKGHEIASSSFTYDRKIDTIFSHIDLCAVKRFGAHIAGYEK